MITNDDKAVIIDLDSTCVYQHDLKLMNQTYGWHDGNSSIAVHENDLNALAELPVYLTGTSPEEYMFSKF